VVTGSDKVRLVRNTAADLHDPHDRGRLQLALRLVEAGPVRGDHHPAPEPQDAPQLPPSGRIPRTVQGYLRERLTARYAGWIRT